MIHYQLPINNEVKLSIYNLLGQEMASLVNEFQAAGKHQISWNAEGFASGVYFYRISTNEGYIKQISLFF